jgi:hypothetical protein
MKTGTCRKKVKQDRDGLISLTLFISLKNNDKIQSVVPYERKPVTQNQIYKVESKYLEPISLTGFTSCQSFDGQMMQEKATHFVAFKGQEFPVFQRSKEV